VTLVAAYEFIKAAGLLLIFGGMWRAHSGDLASAAVGHDAPSIDGPFILVIGLYLVVLGLGIWNLQRWARWLILFAFALMAPRWMVLPIPSGSDFATLREILPQPMALLIVALDVLAVWVLLSPGTRKAFGDVESDLP
jgi:hypothetical protein